MKDVHRRMTLKFPKLKVIEKHSLNAREEIHHCVPDSPTGDCFTNSYGEYIATPSIYPCYIACTAYVTYDVTVCYDAQGNLLSLHVFNLYLHTFLGSCADDLYDCIHELTDEEQFYFYDRMQQELSFIIEDNFLSNLSGIRRCPNTSVTVNYTKESCYALCFDYSAVEHELNYTLGTCGFTCCTRSRSVCKDNNGNLVYGTPSFSSSGTVGCESSINIDNCTDQPCFTAPCGLY
ncbi:MAG: hypothetical protein U0T81_16780 [Saprospiraceae bacterium]